MGAARACAAALAGGDTYTVQSPAEGTCELVSDITANADSAKATAAVVTVGSNGAATQKTKSTAI